MNMHTFDLVAGFFAMLTLALILFACVTLAAVLYALGRVALARLRGATREPAPDPQEWLKELG